MGRADVFVQLTLQSLPAFMQIKGHDAAISEFEKALHRGQLHHAWLLSGPQGLGKASFAHAAALRLLAESAGEMLSEGLQVPASSPTRALIEAGSHPDLRVIKKLTKETTAGEEIARSITIAQIRQLQTLFATTPSIGKRRVIILDAVDDLERAGANALLKNLEEPPKHTIFLLVSHVPGRLLPTILSRCRILRFKRLSREITDEILQAALPDEKPKERQMLADAGSGSPGVSIRYAGLGLDIVEDMLDAILSSGDPNNDHRTRLANLLSGTASRRRYEAFLERVPAYLAAARARPGINARNLVQCHAAARELADTALRLSLDPRATVFEMGSIVAGLHSP